MNSHRNISSLFVLLLRGYFLQKRARPDRKMKWCLYKESYPLEYINDKSLKKIYHLTKIDRKGRLTLNRTVVRSLHGNDGLKKLYKSEMKKHDCASESC